MTAFTGSSPENTDYGSDVSCFPGLDPTFSEISGTQTVAQGIAMRWSMPQGHCQDDPDAGYYAILALNRPMSKSEAYKVQQKLQTEAEKDQRVYSCPVRVTFDPGSRSMLVTADVDCMYGTFPLTVSIDKVSLKLLGIP